MADRRFEKRVMDPQQSAESWVPISFDDLRVGDVCRAFESDGTPVKHPGNGTLWRVTELQDSTTVMAEGLA